MVDDLDPVSLATRLATATGEDLAVWLERIMQPPASGGPKERGLFWLLPDGIVHRLGDAEATALGALAREAVTTRQSLFYCLVDPGLFPLVLDLYAAGHPTEAGCQGRSHAEEFTAKRHCPAAYLTFAVPLPEPVRESLLADGLEVYAQGAAVGAVPLHVDDQARAGSIRGYRKVTAMRLEEDFDADGIRIVSSANASFVGRVRRAFALDGS